jgi:hypothetical protein
MKGIITVRFDAQPGSSENPELAKKETSAKYAEASFSEGADESYFGGLPISSLFFSDCCPDGSAARWPDRDEAGGT